nr:uncharacterized protein LOC123767016 [Procambarus clarkii]
MDIKPEECTVCLGTYDEALLRPRSLPCGHTFCSQCIENAIKDGQLTCPGCSAQHSATAATQFPIIYGMEALIRKLKGTQVTSPEAAPTMPSQTPPRGISKKVQSLVEEQKNSISSLITVCEGVLLQLGEYRGQLGDWKTHHLQLQDRLYGLVEQNQEAMELLDQEDANVVVMATQGEEGKTQLQGMLGALDTNNTAQEIFITIDRADQCNVQVEDWLQNCQQFFPDVSAVSTSVKVQETIREALDKMTTETDDTAAPLHLGDKASTIMEKVRVITRRIPRDQSNNVKSGLKKKKNSGKDSLVSSPKAGDTESRMDMAGDKEPVKKTKKKSRKNAVPLADVSFTNKLLNVINAATASQEVATNIKTVVEVLNRGTAELVIMAANGPYYKSVEELPTLCKEKNVPYVYVKSMALLCAACNVFSEEGTRACAFISKEGSNLKHQIQSFRKKAEKLHQAKVNVEPCTVYVGSGDCRVSIGGVVEGFENLGSFFSVNVISVCKNTLSEEGGGGQSHHLLPLHDILQVVEFGSVTSMGENLVSLKWNNHMPTFFNLLQTLREKGSYTDVTLACGSKFFAVHRLVLTACSDFFTEIFKETLCKKPMIVLIDIKCQELEALLDYMYLGEAVVQQTDIPGIIKAAECLKIKGLSATDEDPTQFLKPMPLSDGQQPEKRRRRDLGKDAGNQESTKLLRRESTCYKILPADNTASYMPHRTNNIPADDKIEVNRSKCAVPPANVEASRFTAPEAAAVQCSDSIDVQQGPDVSPSKTHMAQMHHNSQMLHNMQARDLHSQPGPQIHEDIDIRLEDIAEIKIENIEIEEEIKNSVIKSEISPIQNDPLSELLMGRGDFSHSLSVEENLANHVFHQAPKEHLMHPVLQQTPKTNLEHPVFQQAPKTNLEHPVFQQAPKTNLEHPVFQQAPKTNFEHPVFQQAPKTTLEHPVFQQALKDNLAHSMFHQAPKDTLTHPAFQQTSMAGPSELSRLEVDDLRRLSEPIKSLLKANRVLAVQHDQFGSRCARLSLQAGRVCLHTLLHHRLPTHTHTLQHSDVMGLLDPSSTLAFLDLWWAGSTRGQVMIRLSPDTGLARQFVLLCTGQRGHTYQKTKLFLVWPKDQPGECVVGGDYEANDGRGGAPLLANLEGQYRMSGKAGTVWSPWALGSAQCAQFFISTRELPDGQRRPHIFGEVVSGLDVVRAAASLGDITDVTVVDCGIVIPL